MAAYKAVNTADSMIGHLDDRHGAFGWAAARFDDLINLPAARLSALLIAAASGRPVAALRAALRDAPRHRSPNAGWPEAAMAGGLGIELAGPRSYAGRLVDDPPMGAGGRTAATADIERALRVYRLACLLGLIVLITPAATRPSS
jgi:adenosylcobinamide-phosphate synthase